MCADNLLGLSIVFRVQTHGQKRLRSAECDPVPAGAVAKATRTRSPSPDVQSELLTPSEVSLSDCSDKEWDDLVPASEAAADTTENRGRKC